MRSFHHNWAYVMVVVTGLTGLWGIGLAVAKRPVGRVFHVAVGASVVVSLVQVTSGLMFSSGDGPQADGFHTFYGVLIAVSLAFAYIYRGQFSRRPGLSYGLLLLWIMGLALRAWGF